MTRFNKNPNCRTSVKSDKARIDSFPKTQLKTQTTSLPAVNEDFSIHALIVDTGSSNTWVGAGTKYDPRALSTSKDAGDSVSISYGSFSGEEYTDTVTLGSLTLTGQSLGSASSATGFSGVDGIIGFGPDDLTTGTVPTVVDTAYSEGLISRKVFGVSFAPIIGSSTTASNGEITFGGIDSSKYTGSITYIPSPPALPPAITGVLTFRPSLMAAPLSNQALWLVLLIPGITLIYIPDSAYNVFLKATGGSLDFHHRTALPPHNTLFLKIDQVAGGSAGGYYSYIGSAGTITGSVNFILGQKIWRTTTLSLIPTTLVLG
ncbi:hypothetical protein BZG36_01848 [Bifiguratus adelaidae]|uniref:Peptidase A1 domain-containing protein n=1 Tax=Bifiguratus adelaidae TaxID=1938954 RepID=A0A261Y2C7_9FUNG|nr:hypothetical protein BZG36_01848 [Bifiguratus adelaidae]